MEVQILRQVNGMNTLWTFNVICQLSPSGGVVSRLQHVRITERVGNRTITRHTWDRDNMGQSTMKRPRIPGEVRRDVTRSIKRRIEVEF